MLVDEVVDCLFNVSNRRSVIHVGHLDWVVHGALALSVYNPVAKSLGILNRRQMFCQALKHKPPLLRNELQ